jgi:hypothetical protein
VGTSGSLRAGADTSNLDIWSETTKMVKNCLKRTLVAEISRIKVPKKGDPESRRTALFHTAILSNFNRGFIDLITGMPSVIVAIKHNVSRSI